MELFPANQVPTSELLSINRCRLYLQAFFISDIADGSGTYIMEDAWHGRKIDTVFKNKLWPQQGNPKRSDWSIWREKLKLQLLVRGLRLKSNLGDWFGFNSNWPWYFSPADGNLYHFSDTGWQSFPPVNARKIKPVFSGAGRSVNQTPRLCRATVYSKGSQWVCSGFGNMKDETSNAKLSFYDYVMALPDEERWCFEFMDLEDEGQTIAKAIKNGSAIAVSDGSFKESYGTAA
jgi:hypothetical protein